MSLATLLDDLRRRGVVLNDDGGVLRYRAPKGALADGEVRLLREHRADVLALLRGGATGRGADLSGKTEAAGTGRLFGARDPSQKPHKAPNPGFAGVVRLGGREYPYSAWDGRPLGGGRLGFDTETAPIAGHEPPDLAVAQASDGERVVLVHPDRLGEFLRAHAGQELVLHNAAFDYWVVERHLRLRGEAEALRAWEAVFDDRRAHDSMLMDQLLRIARGDTDVSRRDVAEVAREYAGVELDKSDPYRLRYGELIGRDWAGAEEGFFTYAAKDAVAPLAAYEAMLPAARRLMERYPPACPADAARHGLLSEAVQVKGAVSLARVTARRMHLDRGRVGGVRDALLLRRQGHLGVLERDEAWRGVVKRGRDGSLLLTRKTGAPSLDQKRLHELLRRAAADDAAAAGVAAVVPLTAKGRVSERAEDWAHVASRNPLVSAWLGMVETTSQTKFVANLAGDVVHPKYEPLLRTGRTSCSSPNVQNMPRKGGFREMFVPAPGHVLLVVDFSFAELRTLAAECEARYGFSKLGEVIRQGIDPHAYTAAVFAGETLEEFMARKGRDGPEGGDRFKELRQRAKVFNFGIPGGMGADTLVGHAWDMYRVRITREQAEKFRRRLVEEVYPELARYLDDGAAADLTTSLLAPPEDCQRWLSDFGSPRAVRNVVSGKAFKKDGTPYKPVFVDRVWTGLAALNRNPELARPLLRREGGPALEGRLFGGAAVTLTGRVRGGVSYTEARNTPFQGLAADGAKLALWALTRAGYRVVAFVHDEFVIELREGADYEAEAEQVMRLANGAMESVTGGVPSGCEYVVTRRWSKRATEVRDSQGKLVPWEEEGDGHEA
jgi:hypothetical protein